MRNALMQRPQAAGYEEAAAPAEEPPVNPLTQRRGGPEQPQGDPTADFMAKAAAAGVDIEGELAKGGDQQQVLMRAMQQIWAKEPSDENGEMLEVLSQHLGVPPPWQQQQQTQPPQAPPAPPQQPQMMMK